MSRFIRLILLTLAMVIILGLYFEYCVSRPLNLYLQYAATAAVIILSIFYVTHLIKQLIKIFNP